MRNRSSIVVRAVLPLVALLIGIVAGAVLRSAVEAPETGTTAAPRPKAVAEETSPGEVDAAEPTEPGPRSSVSGVGVGFEPSKAGAVAAAVSYATAAQSWLYLTDEQLRAAASAVIASDVRDELVDDLTSDVQLLRDELQDASGTVWYVMAPLATHLDSFSSSHAVVRVWVVRVLAADGVAVPQSGWQTLTIELTWEESDWRVADVSEAEGPTPQLESDLQPWAADYLEETLAGFVRVGIVQ